MLCYPKWMSGVACQMAQTWWLRKLVDLDRDRILHPIHRCVIFTFSAYDRMNSIIVLTYICTSVVSPIKPEFDFINNWSNTGGWKIARITTKSSRATGSPSTVNKTGIFGTDLENFLSFFDSANLFLHISGYLITEFHYFFTSIAVSPCLFAQTFQRP